MMQGAMQIKVKFHIQSNVRSVASSFFHSIIRARRAQSITSGIENGRQLLPYVFSALNGSTASSRRNAKYD